MHGSSDSQNHLWVLQETNRNNENYSHSFIHLLFWIWQYLFIYLCTDLYLFCYFLAVSLMHGAIQTIIAELFRPDVGDLRFFDNLRTLLEMFITFWCFHSSVQDSMQPGSYPQVWQLMSPSSQVHCTFTYISCKRFVELSPTMHTMLLLELSFSQGLIIVTDFLPKLLIIFWLTCLVWCMLLPDSPSNRLTKVTFLMPSVANSTGLTSQFISTCVFSRVVSSMDRLLLIYRDTDACSYWCQMKAFSSQHPSYSTYPKKINAILI